MRKRCDGDMGRKLREACRRVRNAILGGSILICAAMALTGCHGARGSAAFEIPAEFDTGNQHEITFFAKNDTN